MSKGNFIPINVKISCCKMSNEGKRDRQIYDEYFKHQFDNPQTFKSFCRSMRKWKGQIVPDETTLICGTYEGFTAHGATVQVSKSGEIVQAWIKQKADGLDPEDFIKAIKTVIKPYRYQTSFKEDCNRMLEIPLFDMHWGVSFMDHYEPVLKEVLEVIDSRHWDKIVIPFGQDFFHNDSIVNGQTTKGTNIEKVDMIRAVKEGTQFIYKIIDESIDHANSVSVLYIPGNHDQSISWMLMQVLLERYGSDIVDDSMQYRKVITYGKNSIMVTHGDSKQATAKNLAHIFPVYFPEEFANSSIREVHSGHLHHEAEADIYGVMVRRLSSGGSVDEWTNRQDFVGTNRRFMLFEWNQEKLKSIHYI